MSLRNFISIVIYAIITFIFLMLVAFVLNAYGIINMSTVITDFTVRLSKKSIIEIGIAIIVFSLLIKAIHVSIWVLGKNLPSWVKILLTIVSLLFCLFMVIGQLAYPCTSDCILSPP